jgi:hypothetical protein
MRIASSMCTDAEEIEKIVILIINDREICMTTDTALTLLLQYAPEEEVVVYTKTKTPTQGNRVLKLVLLVLTELEKKLITMTAARRP